MIPRRRFTWFTWLTAAAAALSLTKSAAAEEKATHPENTNWDVSIPEAARNLTGNKKLVFSTWQAFWRGDVGAGLANMTDDVTWLIPGKMKTSGLKDGKDAVRKFRHGNLHIFAEQHHKVVGIYGDGDVVVMEMSSTGKLRNGTPYDNAGVTVWEIEGGKIKRVREYVDTYKAMAVNEVVQNEASAPKP